MSLGRIGGIRGDQNVDIVLEQSKSSTGIQENTGNTETQETLL